MAIDRYIDALNASGLWASYGDLDKASGRNGGARSLGVYVRDVPAMVALADGHAKGLDDAGAALRGGAECRRTSPDRRQMVAPECDGGLPPG
jgi:hypothetical protein